ncbi:MAG: hypothetical protein KDI22_02750 [Gammaproteobacteria bacterium]|nr:hypothetical protein [Gammaproteobacteria bacterium]MCP5316709.1 hypothetical protein [Chromatiaceae bacterium]MCW5587408.1 hypothetical protein [Chromatiales bacterium]HOP17642.1 hypothetical protein [Gammaproteobacteria bacterium]HPQ24861.1 hypothetical protein [Gammaproteobacteria bacterium]
MGLNIVLSLSEDRIHTAGFLLPAVSSAANRRGHRAILPVTAWGRSVQMNAEFTSLFNEALMSDAPRKVAIQPLVSIKAGSRVGCADQSEEQIRQFSLDVRDT